jgi:hypothetical protein
MADFSLSIQAAPWSILNEGIDAALDFMQANGLDAIHLNTHTYYGGGGGNRGGYQVWAPDHFVSDPDKRWQGLECGAWIRHDPDRFADVGLFHKYGGDEPDSDRFDAIVHAAGKRDMKIFGRYLDGWERNRHEIPGWTDVLCVSPTGEQLTIPCFNNPRVRRWSRLTMEDIAAHPHIEGLLYGCERGTPLDDVLLMGQHPYCFCEHCRSEAGKRGIDAQRAAAGFAELSAWARRFRDDPDYLPATDPLSWLTRFYQRCPDVWAYNEMQTDALLAMEREAAEAYKAAAPGRTFAALTHPASSWYAAMTHEPGLHVGHCDVLAPRLYEHIHGARLVENIRVRDARRFLRCYSEPMRWEIAWRCYAGPEIPVPSDPDVIMAEGIDPDVACMKLAALHARHGTRVSLQALVGVDITHPFTDRRETPEGYTQAICRGAVASGAEGIILCREYQEISGASIRAARRAIDGAGGEA